MSIWSGADTSEKSLTDRLLAMFTALLVFVGLLQLFVFGIQARRLRQTIESTDKIAKIQLRAYVFVAEAKIIDPDSANPSAAIMARNFGQTPAYDTIVAAIIRLAPDGEIPFPEPVAEDNVSNFVLAPEHSGVKTMVLERLLNPQTMKSLRARQPVMLYAWGFISYRDVFNRPQRTNFRLSIGGPQGWPETNLMVVSPDGNSIVES